MTENNKIRGTSNKGKWYKLLIDKMEDAIKNRYYLEAIFIEYMIIDDRIKSMAKSFGINVMITNKSTKMLGQLIDEVKAAKNPHNIARWDYLCTGIPLASKDFLKQIKEKDYPFEMIREANLVPRKLVNYRISKKDGRYVSAYIDNETKLLDQIKKWCEFRNHWMHAAGDDALTLEEYEMEIRPLAIDGDSFVRQICDVQNKVKNEIKKAKKNKLD